MLTIVGRFWPQSDRKDFVMAPNILPHSQQLVKQDDSLFVGASATARVTRATLFPSRNKQSAK
jgi:hypothetical protein